MGKIRVCPNCGKVENRFTYFCTECGTKTNEADESVITNKSTEGKGTQQFYKKETEERVETKAFEYKNQSGESQNIRNENKEVQNFTDENFEKRQEESSSVYKNFENVQLEIVSKNFEEQYPLYNHNREEKNTVQFTEQKVKRKILSKKLMIVSAVVIIFFVVFVSFSSSDNDSYNEDLVELNNDQEYHEQEYQEQDYYEDENDNLEENLQYDENADEIMNSELADVENFILTNSHDADYSQNLDYTQFNYYDSGISDFSFYYPTNLYSVVDDTIYPSKYGNTVRQYNFSENENNRLEYKLIEADWENCGISYNDLSAAAEYVYSCEIGLLYENEDIMKSVKDNRGWIIFTGYEDSGLTRPVYNLIKIDGQYIQKMKVVIPSYTSRLDEIQKAYYVECLYRMAGFTNSNKTCRTYEEFYESNT